MSAKGRRGHGEGSIYQRSSDGRWVGSVDFGYVDGKRVRKIVYRKTRTQVRDALKQLQRQADDGLDPTRGVYTVSQWLDSWMEDKKSAGTRASTLRSYEWLIRLHIKPALGSKRLDRVTPDDVRRLISQKNQSGLSPTTVGHIVRLLRNSLADAFDIGLVTRNVALPIKPPKSPAPSIKALTVADVRALIRASEASRLHALFLTTLLLGLRRGEVLALTWDDIDFEHATIRINKSLQREEGKLQIVATKTKSSNAVLAMPTDLVPILARHRKEQREQMMALGPDWPRTNLVFTSTIGTPLEPRNVSREWSRIRDGAGMPDVRLHDLRHACATILTALGVHPRVIMEIMRHSAISVTMNVYAHVAPEVQREAADALGSALFG